MFQTCFLEYYTFRCQNIQENFSLAVNCYDPDGTHDLRVEIKRLRAFFKLIEWITPTFIAKKNIRNIRKLFKSAAELRDIHVQQMLTREWAEDLGVFLSEYYNTLKQKELPAQEQFMTFARRFDLPKEVLKNKKRLLQSLEPLSDEYASSKIQARIDYSLRQIIEYDGEKGHQEEDLHQIRILTKETRYIAEIAQDCFPELGYDDEFIGQLRGIHQALGNWHDTEIALEHVEDFLDAFPELSSGNSSSPPLTPPDVYDRLVDKLKEDKESFFTMFEERWHEFVLVLNK